MSSVSYLKINSHLLLLLFLCAGFAWSISNISSPENTSPTVALAGQDQLQGFAWSDTVGWICFSNSTYCPTAVVNVDASGNITGYAWSDAIGWIQFGGLSGFPSGEGTQSQNANINGNNLKGWARAVAADGNGWDGWISLSGSGYGPALSGGGSGAFSGYAWGSDVVGWIDFSTVNFTTFSAPTFTALPDNLLLGQSPTLTWNCPAISYNSSHGDTNFTTGGALSGNTPPASPPPSNTTYTLTCTTPSGSGTNVTASVSVSVPDLSLTAVPTRVQRGGTSTLTWSATNVNANSCSLTTSLGVTLASGQNSGSVSPVVNQQTIYTLSCIGGSGAVTKTATVTIVPAFQEI